MTALQITACVLAAAGLIFMAISLLGIIRFPDFYTRLHAQGIGDTLGAFLVLIAMMLSAGNALMALKLFLVFVMILLTNPVGTNLMMIAAIHKENYLNYDADEERILEPEPKPEPEPEPKPEPEPEPQAAAGTDKKSAGAGESSSAGEENRDKKGQVKKNQGKKSSGAKGSKGAGKKNSGKKNTGNKSSGKKSSGAGGSKGAGKKSGKKSGKKKSAKKK